ncbi:MULTISPECIES: DNA-processing protein DprA [unclassified Streptomyces]|uniref:DNA-processing protein DprA n=1 Tax=unclassified Streptomyces TaxID=2593676 RepID=UPI001BEC97CD|nr:MULTISPECIES: DNA-processing protein DprA [unclassified Streptomyces]MBT2406054.1 DNA-processing protein DprA [Streptomyces sp. ISL-21]MBT2610656.1 DNA-processing protein DprA [Streptomyces sp. ISL-87]
MSAAKGLGPQPDREPEPEPGPGPELEVLARAALTRVLEPGEEHGGRWLRAFGGVGLIRLLTGPETEMGALTGVGPERLCGYRRRAALADPRRDLAAAAASGGRFVCPGAAEWPTQLDDLGDARPIGLWLRGRPNLRTWALRSVAVVGARACTPYGAHMAQTLAGGLAERGWVVVSGAAYGIDGAAHRGALASGGATAAVLACGVDVDYPRGHAGLLGRIAGQGLVLGELPPGSHPTPSRFVLRNRVIAALTRGTVVVEAAHRSGSLVTARRAQALGRLTMGVPGPATSGLSAGVHELLRGEAQLVTDAAEVIELVGGMGDLAPERRGPVLARDLLDPATVRVLEALPAGRLVNVDEVTLAAATDTDEVIGRLYELHSLGFVERQGDGWQLTTRTPGPGTQTRATRRGGG